MVCYYEKDCIILAHLFVKSGMAQQFISNSTVTYDVASDGTTSVSHDITLQNISSDFYATSYTLSLTDINPINPRATEGGGSLPVSVTTKDGNTLIKVDFPNAVVGKGSKREFFINFEDKTFVSKTGEIWEVNLPRLGNTDSFDFYSTILKVPKGFGQLAYISPNPSFKSDDKSIYTFSFDKQASINGAVTAAFGQFQVFTFNLTYHLENPLNQNASIDVALPPDTNYQRMNYQDITPKPAKITVDPDGNWLATFDLKARERVDVKAKGAVQLFASSIGVIKTDQQSLNTYLNKTTYWQTDDSQIKSLAQQLKTPQAIYNYVTSTLSYDYSRVSPNVQRLGATETLKNPKNAICTEFTDLFIAIARAAGIPAREMEGFAYTENPQIQPLSLVADVLHAWPEYWDSVRQSWIPVDPTWGETSRIDYFNKLDLRHFAFVIHGQNDTKPYPAGSYKLGVNPQKDVDVTFGSLPVNRNSLPVIENKVLAQIPFADQIIDTKVKNSGPVALYNLTYQVQFDNNIKNTKIIDVIPPYGEYDSTIDVPYSFLGQKVPSKVQVLINGAKKSEFNTYKTYVTISNLLMICLLMFFILFLAYLKFKDARTKRKA